MVAELQMQIGNDPVGPTTGGSANTVAEKKVGRKVIRLAVGDITDIEVEAFVYDITENAQLGSGYGSAITQRAGKAVQDQLDQIGKCPPGEAIYTTAGDLKAKHIIYINGPKFHEPGTEEKLRRAVKAGLALAEVKGIKQLAFPPVGTGLYQVPLDLCARVLMETVTDHLTKAGKLEEVVFVAFDTRELKPFKAKL